MYLRCTILSILLINSYFPLISTDRTEVSTKNGPYRPRLHISKPILYPDIDEVVLLITGGPKAAQDLANRYGFLYGGEMIGFPNMYIFKRPDQKTKRAEIDLSNMTTIEEVKWLSPQTILTREKRDLMKEEKSPYYSTNSKKISMKLKRRQDIIKTRQFPFNDEMFGYQWYLDGQEDIVNLSMRVSDVWKMGYTGKGIVVTVLDDGLEHTHNDIKLNYDPRASLDVNDNDHDPFPRREGNNAHGTRCAGEIAMQANNLKCGVGVAFNCRLGGIRLLDGRMTDRTEATSLIHALDYIDIYSASWGPNDDGLTVDGPRDLTLSALRKGTTYGRNGKGAIYVWASGNGGGKGDNCNCDGYASSIYTISVGSISQTGRFPWYGEKCASTIAVTYSSGEYDEEKIMSTDLFDSCTIEHSGTSASAPIAAGIIALVLEANPELTWRDIQHLIIHTTDVKYIRDTIGWRRNGIGLLFNNKYGFGLLDAHEMVKSALQWQTVPPQSACQLTLKFKNGAIQINSGHLTEIVFKTAACLGDRDEINYLEHVQLVATIDYSNRGRLEIKITSPSNTTTTVMSPRPRDISRAGYYRWSFTSLHLWGERPVGQWKILIQDKSNELQKNHGVIKDAKLILYGTKEIPYHMTKSRQYDRETIERLLSKSNVSYI